MPSLLRLVLPIFMMIDVATAASSSGGEYFFHRKTKYEILTDSTCRYVRSYEGYYGIPDSVKFRRMWYKVTSIATDAFRGSSVQQVIIPKSVKEICRYAFVQSKLAYIEIPATVEYVDEFAFVGNDQLVMIDSKTTAPISNMIFFLNPIKYANIVQSSLISEKRNENMMSYNGIPSCTQLKALHLKADTVVTISEDIMDADVLRDDVNRICPFMTYDALGYGCFWQRSTAEIRIYVPLNLLPQYKSDPTWGEFKFLLGE